MKRFDELLNSVGIPVVDVPEVGQFVGQLGGGWRHSCTVDFPFQEGVDLIIDLDLMTPNLPASMPHNVSWIQDHFADIWNTGAAAINEMSELENINAAEEFALDTLFIELPDAPVENAKWTLLIEPSYVQGTFKLTFKGLVVVNQEFEGP